MALDNNREWRDCCCHVQQSMSVASAFMIFGAILIGFYSMTFNVFHLIGSALWLTSGICAIAAVQKAKPNLLIVTIVIVLIALVVAVVQLSFILIAWTKIIKLVGFRMSFDYNHLPMITISAISAFLVLDIWYLIVSVKCRQYMFAQQAIQIQQNSTPQTLEIKTITLP